mgnify:CR=1 FL=1
MRYLYTHIFIQGGLLTVSWYLFKLFFNVCLCLPFDKNKIVIMCELLEVCVPLCVCMFRTCQFGMIFIYGLITCCGECIQECCPNCCNKCLHKQQKPISVEDVRVSCSDISLPIFEEYVGLSVYPNATIILHYAERHG